MSWTKKNVHPGKILSTSEEITVQVLEVDPVQAAHFAGPQADPEQSVGNLLGEVSRSAPHVEGEIKNITEFGLFVGLDGDVDGMVHLSDLDWKRPGEEAIKDYKKGDMRQGQSFSMSTVEKERISLGIKQMAGDPPRSIRLQPASRRAIPSPAKWSRFEDAGLEVKIAGSDMTAFIKRADLARDRSEQRPERFAVGEKVDAKVTSLRCQGAQDVRCRSRRWKSPMRRQPWPSMARPIRALRWATFSAPP